METQIKKIRFDKEFRVCPDCGYQDGFHTMLKADGSKVRWLFICPSCHHIFDVGYTIPDSSLDRSPSGN